MIDRAAALRFEDSPEQALLRETVRGLLAARYPFARLYEIESGTVPLTVDDLREPAELGWLALLVPEAAGGAGLSLLEAAVVVEEVGYSGAPLPVVPANVAAAIVGSPAPFRSVGEGDGPLPRLGPAGLTGTIELVAAADLATGVVTRLDGDAGSVLAIVDLAACRLRPAPAVDLAASFDVVLDGVPPAAAEHIARGAAAEERSAHGEVLLCAFRLLEAAGMMRRVVELTRDYITDRVVFGHPVARFQAARHRAANLFMDAEATRWAAYHAVGRLEADPLDTGGVWLARHWAARATERVIVHGHMLHGGVGVTMDHPLHLFTQGLMARAVRGGTLEGIVARATAWLDGEGDDPVRVRGRGYGC